jgi:hypothetical protein
MISNYFIVICLLLFFAITIYTIFIILFDKKIIDFKNLFKFLNFYGQAPLFLIFVLGFFSFIIYGIISSTTYIKSISDITKDNGLGSFGDFFNGLITPIVSLISIIYIYKAFVQQFKANEMLYKFELKRDVKEDLDWLRDNSSFLKQLETDINDKDRDELEDFFNVEKELLNKLTYTVLIFNETLKKTKTNDLELKYNTEVVLISFYLKAYKSIFRDLNHYMINTYGIDNDYYQDLTKTEINFVLKFIDLYDHISKTDTENNFVYTINEAKNNIKNGRI